MQFAAPVEPRFGFLVDPNGLSATCRSDALLSRTLEALRAREALDVLDYPGDAGTSPLLVAYGAAEAEWGILLRECPEHVERSRRAPVATLCALLARLADQRNFAG